MTPLLGTIFFLYCSTEGSVHLFFPLLSFLSLYTLASFPLTLVPLYDETRGERSQGDILLTK